MMKRIFLISTTVFWILVAGVWAAGQATAPGGAPAAPPTPQYSLATVAEHATDGDCWMVIHGQVYDLSAYLPSHPTRPSIILPWCGKEASEAYDTKMRGRPHSSGADQLLDAYRIGIIQP